MENPEKSYLAISKFTALPAFCTTEIIWKRSQRPLNSHDFRTPAAYFNSVQQYFTSW